MSPAVATSGASPASAASACAAVSGPDRVGTASDAEALAACFLAHVLPSEGIYFLATPYPKRGFEHYACNSIDEAARRAIDLDAQGKTVYFATASFVAPYVNTPQKDGATKKQYRIRSNVRSLRSLFLDIDVKPNAPNAYATQKEMLGALNAFFIATKLPIPLLVGSGTGLHLYWVFTADVPVDEWQPAGDKLKALCTKLEFKADPSRTDDATSVLRPVGTRHRKDPANPRDVKIVGGDDAKPVEISIILDDACARHEVDVAPRREKSRETEGERLNEAFAIQREFPPYSVKKIADKCKQVGAMRDSRGCVPEPHWYTVLQLIAGSVEGEGLAHSWSNGYAGYSQAETDTKLAQVEGMGPPLCATFESRNPGGCAGCRFSGKISSPAQLESIVEITPVAAQPEPRDGQPSQQAQPPQADESEAGSVFGGTTSSVDLQTPPATPPTLHLLDEMNSQYAWVQRQKQIFRFQYQDFIKPQEFKTALANRPPVLYATQNSEKSEQGADPGQRARPKPLADAWLSWPSRREHGDIVYEPGRGPVFDNKINLWSGWGCEPAAGDITPWRVLLDEAYGVDRIERIYFEQWAAFQIQHPGTKLFTATVLWSTQQGVGKTLIGETFGKIFGENSDVITESDLYGEFNEWVKGKQFILGEEIMSTKQPAVMNRLKHLITGEKIRMNDKNQPKIVLRNTINFMLTSNHPNAVHIDLNDRRFFVVEFAGGKLPADFFADFVDWRDNRGGLSTIMHHLLHLPLDGFDPTVPPPMTRAKEEMMDATFTDLERWIFERFLDPNAPVQSEVVYAVDLAGQYLDQRGQHVSDTAVGRALTRLGSRVKKRVTFPEARKQLHAIRRQNHWGSANERAWVDEYEKGRTFRAQAASATSGVSFATVPRYRQGLN